MNRKLLGLALLFAVAALAAIPAGAVAQAQGTAPDALYKKHCQSCHGPVGGAPPAALQKTMKVPNLGAPGFLDGRSQDSLVAVMRQGINPFMKPVAGKLSPAEMVALARYLRESAKTAGAKPRGPNR